MGVRITNVELSENTLRTGETFMVAVSVKESTDEPKMYRLAIKLGSEKGGIR